MNPHAAPAIHDSSGNSAKAPNDNQIAGTSADVQHARAFVEKANYLYESNALTIVESRIPWEETSRIMMKVYSLVSSHQYLLKDIHDLTDALPPYPESGLRHHAGVPLREILYALIVRSIAEGGGGLSRLEYDALTLPWRCRFGPIHDFDDNDVCGDELIEWRARILEDRHPELTRENARTQAYLGQG